MKQFVLAMVVGLAFVLAGCGDKGGHDQGGDDHSGHGEHSGHGHEDHGHSHSHGHAHEPPHGGALNVFGSEFAHFEFLHDKATGELTCYVLGGHAEKAVKLPDETLTLSITADGQSFDVVLAAQANELTGETVGDSSLFVGTDDRLKGQDAFLITAKEVTIKGVTFKDVEMPYPDGNEAH